MGGHQPWLIHKQISITAIHISGKMGLFSVQSHEQINLNLSASTGNAIKYKPFSWLHNDLLCCRILEKNATNDANLTAMTKDIDDVNAEMHILLNIIIIISSITGIKLFIAQPTASRIGQDLQNQ